MGYELDQNLKYPIWIPQMNPQIYYWLYGSSCLSKAHCYLFLKWYIERRRRGERGAHGRSEEETGKEVQLVRCRWRWRWKLMCTRMSLMRQLTLNDVTKSRVSSQSLTDIPPFFNYQSSSTNTTTRFSFLLLHGTSLL